MSLYETGTKLTDGDEFYSGQDPDTIKFLGDYILPEMEAGSSARIKLQNWVGNHLLRDTTKLYPPPNFTKIISGVFTA